MEGIGQCVLAPACQGVQAPLNIAEFLRRLKG